MYLLFKLVAITVLHICYIQFLSILLNTILSLLELHVSDSLVTAESSEYATFAKFKTVPFGDQFIAQLVPSDGNCFFYALAHQLNMSLESAGNLRKEAVDFIRSNADRMVCFNVKQ